MKTDPVVTTQVRLFYELAEFCNNGPVDKKDFRSMAAMYADLYKRLDCGQQGEVSHIIAEYRGDL